MPKRPFLTRTVVAVTAAGCLTGLASVPARANHRQTKTRLSISVSTDLRLSGRVMVDADIRVTGPKHYDKATVTYKPNGHVRKQIKTIRLGCGKNKGYSGHIQFKAWRGGSLTVKVGGAKRRVVVDDPARLREPSSNQTPTVGVDVAKAEFIPPGVGNPARSTTRPRPSWRPRPTNKPHPAWPARPTTRPAPGLTRSGH